MAALARDHHLSVPDAQSSHCRIDLPQYQLRWELHTEFVTWTIMSPLPAERLGETEPNRALDHVAQEWISSLPGQCLTSLHLWVVPALAEGAPALVKKMLSEDALIASSVAGGVAEVYTDFSMRADGFSRMVLLAGALSPRRLGRLVQRLLEIETYRMTALLGLPAA